MRLLQQKSSCKIYQCYSSILMCRPCSSDCLKCACYHTLIAYCDSSSCFALRLVQKLTSKTTFSSTYFFSPKGRRSCSLSNSNSQNRNGRLLTNSLQILWSPSSQLHQGQGRLHPYLRCIDSISWTIYLKVGRQSGRLLMHLWQISHKSQYFLSCLSKFRRSLRIQSHRLNFHRSPWNITRPQANTSDFQEYLWNFIPGLVIQGAIQFGVPTQDRENSALLALLPNPKSASLMKPLLTSIFQGLMSLCTNPSFKKSWNPFARLSRREAFSLKEISLLSKTSLSVYLQRSVTMNTFQLS